MIERNAKWYRFYYIFQELLARDINYMEIVVTEREGKGNGVRAESSLPFALNKLASELTDWECQDEHANTEFSYALNYWNVIELHPRLTAQRETDLKQGVPFISDAYMDKVLRATKAKEHEQQTVHKPVIEPERIFQLHDKVRLLGDVLTYEIVKISPHGYWCKDGHFISYENQKVYAHV